MRKLMLIVAAMLIAAPALATVEIGVTDLGGGEAAITYNCAAGEDVRAFALDITIDNGTIDDVKDFNTGESTAPGGGYGIFPGSFRDIIVPSAPDFDDPNYVPVAPSGDPDALGGLGTAGITVELGSLYVDANSPGGSGTLLVIVTSDGDCNVCVVVNSSRGSVVLEDANAATTNLPLSPCVLIGPAGCYPTDITHYADWIALGEPECWCTPYQCDGDADGVTFGLLKRRVWNADYDLLVDNWGLQAGAVGFNPCTDFDHKSFGLLKRRVWDADYDILVAHWGMNDAAMAADGLCPKQR